MIAFDKNSGDDQTKNFFSERIQPSESPVRYRMFGDHKVLALLDSVDHKIEISSLNILRATRIEDNNMRLYFGLDQKSNYQGA